MKDVRIDAIKKLREITGMSLVECKKALIESDFDLELAVKNVQSIGRNISPGGEGDHAKSGIVLAKLSEDHRTGVILSVGCETDFVARTEVFRSLCRKILDFSLGADVVHAEHLRDEFAVELIRLSNVVGEKVDPTRFGKLIGDVVSSYVHQDKIGVLLSTSGCEDREALRKLAMHIAASGPICIDREHIPDDLLERYREECHISASRTDLGRDDDDTLDRFSRQFVLAAQRFIFDVDISVEQFTRQQNIRIDNFLRFEI